MLSPPQIHLHSRFPVHQILGQERVAVRAGLTGSWVREELSKAAANHYPNRPDSGRALPGKYFAPRS